MSNTVCRCAGVDVNTVELMCELYPETSKKQIKSMLNIGKVCGSCNYKDSIIIDNNFSDLFDNIKKLNK